MNNEACFLEQPAWTSLLRSAVQRMCYFKSCEMSLSLCQFTACIPRLFMHVTAAVSSEACPDPLVLAELQSRARRLRNDSLSWQQKYLDFNLDLIHKGSQNIGYCNIAVMFLFYRILINRLLTAVLWSKATEATELESETFDFANKLRSLIIHAAPLFSHLRGALLMGQKLCLADATISTSQDWRLATATGTKLISQEVFERWTSLFGRAHKSKSSSTV